MILIAYDGSKDAREAIARAAMLFPGQPATILVVWQHFFETMAGAGVGMTALIDYDEIDQAAGRAAEDTAAEGVEAASAVGLEATPRAAVSVGTVATTILTESAGIDADAVVMGSRGLTGVKSLLLGSVSNAVLQHADRPVVVVPSPEIAAERAKRRS